MKYLQRTILLLTVLLFPILHSWAGPQAPEGMVLVPEGEFTMGSSREEVDVLKKTFGGREMYREYPWEKEVPRKKVRLKAFYIDRHEVTNKEYAEFLRATSHPAPRHWVNGDYPGGKGEHPVLYVNKKDAEDYAAWKGKRLPTAEEWEKAARGTDGRVFPWGNEFDPEEAATADSDLTFISHGLCTANSANKVESAPGDISPYGARDMAGNVREWTSTTTPGNSSLAVVKGGSWVDLYLNARAAALELVPDSSMSHIIGFRCALDAPAR